MTSCPACSELMGDRDRFCRLCGAARPEETPTQPTTSLPARPGPGRPPPSFTIFGFSRPVSIAVCLVVLGVPTAFWAISASSGLWEHRPGGEISDLSASEPTETQTITYDLTGTAHIVDITMATSAGTTSQFKALLPLGNDDGEPGMEAPLRSGDFFYIAAQITDTGGGSVTCEVRSGSRVLRSSTSYGFASIVTCSGVVP